MFYLHIKKLIAKYSKGLLLLIIFQSDIVALERLTIIALLFSDPLNFKL